MKYVQPLGNPDPNASYVDGNELTGTEGSVFPAASIEAVMREIQAAITAAGLTPNPAVLNQLALAIAANSTPDATDTVKGKVELATGAEALGGSDSTRAVTSAALASAKSYTANGYQKLPGGLIIQWATGTNQTTETTQTITFPIAFPTACLHVQCGEKNPTNDPGVASQSEFVSATTTGAVVRNQLFTSTGIAMAPMIIAIGY